MNNLKESLKAYCMDIKPHAWKIAFFSLVLVCIVGLLSYVLGGFRWFIPALALSFYTPVVLSGYYWRKSRNFTRGEAIPYLREHMPWILRLGTIIFAVLIAIGFWLPIP